jgi:hypothetical protein
VISPTVDLTLLPYLTLAGVIYTPTPGPPNVGLFQNTGGGLYALTLVGVPQPAAGAVLQITSSLGGTSPLHALDRLRQ